MSTNANVHAVIKVTLAPLEVQLLLQPIKLCLPLSPFSSGADANTRGMTGASLVTSLMKTKCEWVEARINQLKAWRLTDEPWPVQ